jgi:hypothetical protein
MYIREHPLIFERTQAFMLAASATLTPRHPAAASLWQTPLQGSLALERHQICRSNFTCGRDLGCVTAFWSCTNGQTTSGSSVIMNLVCCTAISAGTTLDPQSHQHAGQSAAALFVGAYTQYRAL